MNEPVHALHCQRVLAICSKRYERRPVSFLDETEVDALLVAPDLSTWHGRRSIDQDPGSNATNSTTGWTEFSISPRKGILSAPTVMVIEALRVKSNASLP